MSSYLIGVEEQGRRLVRACIIHPEGRASHDRNELPSPKVRPALRAARSDDGRSGDTPNCRVFFKNTNFNIIIPKYYTSSHFILFLIRLQRLVAIDAPRGRRRRRRRRRTFFFFLGFGFLMRFQTAHPPQSLRRTRSFRADARIVPLDLSSAAVLKKEKQITIGEEREKKKLSPTRARAQSSKKGKPQNC